MRPVRAILLTTAAVAVLTAGAAVALPSSAPRPATQVASTIAAAPVDRIAAAQERLRRLPGDWRTWAQLGLDYVDRARLTADPAYYPKAQGALRESLRLRPGNPDALAGSGALANARHDFSAARDLARKALAADAYNAVAVGVLADALTQLGDAPGATDAVQRLLDLKPGLPAYARAAYDLEQHGRLADARAIWLRAAADVYAPEDVAYVHAHLGDLAWLAGDAATAREQHETALRARPAYGQAQAGLARVRQATGDLPGALELWASLTARVPAPSLLIEYADALTKAGRAEEAAVQRKLAEAGLQLFAAAGGRDDLGEAELAIAQGQAGRAIAAARREWAVRRHADVADALAWALHLAGRDKEALGYAREAAKLGNPRYTPHLTAIEAALEGDVS